MLGKPLKACCDFPGKAPEVSLKISIGNFREHKTWSDIVHIYAVFGDFNSNGFRKHLQSAISC